MAFIFEPDVYGATCPFRSYERILSARLIVKPVCLPSIFLVGRNCSEISVHYHEPALRLLGHESILCGSSGACPVRDDFLEIGHPYMPAPENFLCYRIVESHHGIAFHWIARGIFVRSE